MEKVDLIQCLETLESIAANNLLLSELSHDDRVRLFMAAGRVIYPDRNQVRRRVKAMRTKKKQELESKDRIVRASTSIRSTRRESIFIQPPKLIGKMGEEVLPPPPIGELARARECYICKDSFTQVHFFYDAVCPRCAPFNYEKRFQTASLDGRVALITGARLKIGYHAALMMLRAGAYVIVTTRFPQDAAIRFAREADFRLWNDRLQIHGLDLRHSPSVEAFTSFLNQTLGRLDILVNNAAQTVRRPPGFYAHLMAVENQPLDSLPLEVQPLLRAHERLKKSLSGGVDTSWVADWHTKDILAMPGLTDSAALSQIPYRCNDPSPTEHFPSGEYDADLQQVDHRKMNSWRMTLVDVPTSELLEVQLVNSIAPFILCGKLKPLMERENTGEKHIVNVSAMEGKFSRHTKTDKHPHTNMAKAALNMMTLTSAKDYAKSGIFMNAVDTGWVTDEDPAEISSKKQNAHDFQPPLDIVDGAARICDPFFSGLLAGKHSWGNFLKDYFPTQW